jgi:hypothetical protein
VTCLYFVLLPLPGSALSLSSSVFPFCMLCPSHPLFCPSVLSVLPMFCPSVMSVSPLLLSVCQSRLCSVYQLCLTCPCSVHLLRSSHPCSVSVTVCLSPMSCPSVTSVSPTSFHLLCMSVSPLFCLLLQVPPPSSAPHLSIVHTFFCKVFRRSGHHPSILP